MEHLIVDGIGRLKATILGQIGERKVPLFIDFPRSRLFFSHQDFQERRLAGSVLSDQGNPVPFIYLQADIIKKNLPCKRAFNFVGL